jgi:hypothetical protein
MPAAQAVISKQYMLTGVSRLERITFLLLIEIIYTQYGKVLNNININVNKIQAILANHNYGAYHDEYC